MEWLKLFKNPKNYQNVTSCTVKTLAEKKRSFTKLRCALETVLIRPSHSESASNQTRTHSTVFLRSNPSLITLKCAQRILFALKVSASFSMTRVKRARWKWMSCLWRINNNWLNLTFNIHNCPAKHALRLVISPHPNVNTEGVVPKRQKRILET